MDLHIASFLLGAIFGVALSFLVGRHILGVLEDEK